jgi:hypothetical protein
MYTALQRREGETVNQPACTMHAKNIGVIFRKLLLSLGTLKLSVFLHECYAGGDGRPLLPTT